MNKQFAFLPFLCACSGTVVIGDLPPADAGSDTGNNDAAEAGATVAIHLAATAAPYVQTDGLSGETPRMAKIGIRSLTLLASPTDPNPYVVFDNGTSFVEADVDDAMDTLIARVPVSSFQNGLYAWVKVGVSHVHYQVDSTMHALGVATPGVFDNIQVLSNGTVLGGQTYDSGYYSFSFMVGSSVVGTIQGAAGPLPTYPNPDTALVIQNGSASYVFPTTVLVDSSITQTSRVVMTLNVDHDFRWQDLSNPGYTPGVFDSEPTTFEPVLRFGANSFTIAVVK